MVYGLSFNGKDIPEGFKRKLAAKVRIEWLPRGHAYRLVGVATDKVSMLRALEQANNGRRLLHVEVRATAGTPIFGIYAY